MACQGGIKCVVSGVKRSKISRRKGEAHLIKDKNKQMFSNDRVIPPNEPPVSPKLEKRLGGSMRGNIFEEQNFKKYISVVGINI